MYWMVWPGYPSHQLLFNSRQRIFGSEVGWRDMLLSHISVGDGACIGDIVKGKVSL